MVWNFVPITESSDVKVPCFEDARADFAPHYSSKFTIKQAEAAVTGEMGKLNASVTKFQQGKFEVGGKWRYGYAIEFLLNGQPGVIRVAGLPMRSYTAVRETRVKVQCLMNVRDWLKAAVTMQVFSPDTSPLMPYLLVDGKRTIAEYVLTGQSLALPGPSVEVSHE